MCWFYMVISVIVSVHLVMVCHPMYTCLRLKNCIRRCCDKSILVREKKLDTTESMWMYDE